MVIQWYPGHMAKAKKEVIAQLKPVDIVFELVDARLPFSSRNPMLDEIINNKPSLLILNKVDMADKAITKKWLAFFQEQNKKCVLINSKDDKTIATVVREAQLILEPKLSKLRAKGVNPRSLRAMVVGIPNVGKSTFINRFAKKNIAKTGNTPGVTKAQQWIKLNSMIDLLDTPGILWPKFNDPEIGYKLALSGAIKDTILDLEAVAYFGLTILANMYPTLLAKHYQLTSPLGSTESVFMEIGKAKGFFAKDGAVDLERTVSKVINEFRNLQIGTISLEMPTNINLTSNAGDPNENNSTT